MKKALVELPKKIGPYQIVQDLGRGGMGEVFLAIDPDFGRHIAIKRIRPDLKSKRVIQSRFLREAYVASALSHPSIVPILNIQTDPKEIYYTMPYVPGDTLRQVLRQAKSEKLELGAIPSFARIFLQVCQAVAYTHSKGILHRDLKPENIIIGKYDEVMILDWGIADFIDQINDEPLKEPSLNGPDLTKPGKITGTLAYMAPERLLGVASSVHTDLYALGVILYQMLALSLPFERRSLATFRKGVQEEVLISPIEKAPYRDIPHHLSEMCLRMLGSDQSKRFQSANEVIEEIKTFIEGKPEWTLAAKLERHEKEDWQLQASILLTKNIAITQSLDSTEWAELMVSKTTFSHNLRIEAKVFLKERGQGIGFLFSIPEERHTLEDGYCLFLQEGSSKLLRNNVQVFETKGIEPNSWHQIQIAKVDDHIRVFVDGKLKIHYISHLPLAGTHTGLLYKDDRFDLQDLKVFDASHSAKVGCLAVPNALLGHKLYDAALQEYRSIGKSFPGRAEGREALFRAGLTLIERAKAENNDRHYHLALKEFEKLSKTPGALFEYLGKSLVYVALEDPEEEAKCLELALRKFPSHPLLPILHEHIIYRMHESTLSNREAAYRIILLAIRHIPQLLENADTRQLIDSLEKNWEKLPFIEPCPERRLDLIAIQLAFWLAKVPILVEIAQNVKDHEVLFNNALVCLQELEAFDALEKFSPQKPKRKKTLVVWNALLNKRLENIRSIFDRYPHALTKETSPLHFPYGAYLYLTQGPAAASHHFASVLETRYPPTTAVASLFLSNRLGSWMDRAFWWEKKELHRQIDLFYRIIGKK